MSATLPPPPPPPPPPGPPPLSATPPVAMTIAGSDSGGGAGIQADLKAFAAHRVHGTSAIAALTAQNTTEVRSVRPTPPLMLRAQIEAVLDDMEVRGVKTGMLATVHNVRVVADIAAAGRLRGLVVDPVMVSSTGARLLDPEAEESYADLLQHATVATPNCREAAVLLEWDKPITTLDQQRVAALALAARFPGVLVVVKGGDQPEGGDAVIDVEALGSSCVEHRQPRVITTNNHGTGCSFAAAAAAGLAYGLAPSAATAAARNYVHRGLQAAAGWRLGRGHGPIDQFADVYFPPALSPQPPQEPSAP